MLRFMVLAFFRRLSLKIPGLQGASTGGGALGDVNRDGLLVGVAISGSLEPYRWCLNACAAESFTNARVPSGPSPSPGPTSTSTCSWARFR